MSSLELPSSSARRNESRRLNLEVMRGQRHALIGPNGAGKSTLFNLISRDYVPSTGRVLHPRMSVAENPRISVMGRHGHRFTFFRPVRRLARVNAKVDEYLEKLRLTRRRGDYAQSENLLART